MQLIQKMFSYTFYTKPLNKNAHSLLTLDLCYIESKKSEKCFYIISYIIKNTEAKIINTEKGISQPLFFVWFVKVRSRHNPTAIHMVILVFHSQVF
jgi:hypothetical protein